VRHIFVAVHGQGDNIGDSVLRRAMLGAIQIPNSQRHVLVGGVPSSYIEGLALSSVDHVYTSRATWERNLLRYALTGSASYVSNAGEMQVNRRRKRIGLVEGPLARLVRATGGGLVHTGVGLRDPESHAWPVKLVASQARVVAWRDEPSRLSTQMGTVYPDWAFSEGSLPEEWGAQRGTLAVSMRGDQPPPTGEWISVVREFASRHHLSIVAVTQVARDEARSNELATMLDGTVEPWDGTSHRYQEKRVRWIYGRSAAVISDRMHALIMGATEGAVPLGFTVGKSRKIGRTFEGAGLSDPSRASSDFGVESNLTWLDHRLESATTLGSDVAGTRERIAQLESLIRLELSGGAK